jgi:hypothetical protein
LRARGRLDVNAVDISTSTTTSLRTPARAKVNAVWGSGRVVMTVSLTRST